MPRDIITTQYTTRLDVNSSLWSDNIDPWKENFYPWQWDYPVSYTRRTPITTNYT